MVAPGSSLSPELDRTGSPTPLVRRRGFRRAFVHEARRRPPAAGARLARDQADLVEGDRAAVRGRVRGHRPGPARLRRSDRRPTASATWPPPATTCAYSARPPRPRPGGGRGRRSGQPRHPGRPCAGAFVDRMVLFNSPLPYDKARMAGLRTRPASAHDCHFLRQGTDADALAAELSATPDRRSPLHLDLRTRRGSGLILAPSTARPSPSTPKPFGHGENACASSFEAYESTFDPAARSQPALIAQRHDTPDPHPVRPVGPRDLPGLSTLGGRPRLRSSHGSVPAARPRALRPEWEAAHALATGTEAFALGPARRVGPTTVRGCPGSSSKAPPSRRS